MAASYAGLYVCMGAYFLALIGVTVLAFLKKRSIKSQGDAVGAHFGGGKLTFGPFILMLTTFSSTFSGYTVAGVPNESGRLGYYAVRWLLGCQYIAITMLLCFPRLRRLAVTRQPRYMSPSDFLFDRFRSRPLQLLGCAFLCVPQVLYGTVQFVSFASTVMGYIEGVSKFAAMIFLAVVVLGMESLGGMQSVVFSDAMQASLMIIGFLIVPTMLTFKYGGIATYAESGCDGLGYVNANATALLGDEDEPVRCSGPWAAWNATHNATCEPFGCVVDAFPKAMEWPSLAAQTSYFWFYANCLGFPMNPHILQRGVQIASYDGAVRISIATLAVAPFFTMVPGIIMGVVYGTFKTSWPRYITEGAVFTVIGKMLMEEGAGAYFVVMCLTTSVLGAIMSTLDSVIIGVSNTVSVDLSNALGKWGDFTVNVGKVCAASMIVCCCVVGTLVTADDFGTMGIWQNGVLLQIVPAFYLGLYTDVSTYTIFIGLVGGLIGFSLINIIAGDADSNGLLPYIPIANQGFFVNVIITGACFAVECAFPSIIPPPQEDALTVAKIEETMKGTQEPNKLYIAIGFISCNLACPLFMPFDSGTAEILTHGIPQYAYCVFILASICCLALLAAAHSWKPEPGKGSTEPFDRQLTPSSDEDRLKMPADQPATSGSGEAAGPKAAPSDEAKQPNAKADQQPS